MSTAHELKREIASYAQLLHARGWVANHDGNVSHRLDKKGRLLITPTATSKRKCTPESVVSVDADGKPDGVKKLKPPGELFLHRAAYAARADVACVLHAHPPEASAFALAGRPIAPIAMPEVVVSLGAEIPLLPLLVAKDPGAGARVAEGLAAADVLLLAGNGVLVVGADLEQAYLRLELLEHYARILSRALPLGGPKALDGGLVAQLLEQRRAAGLGPRAPAKPAESAPAKAAPSVRSIVKEELERALGGRG